MRQSMRDHIAPSWALEPTRRSLCKMGAVSAAALLNLGGAAALAADTAGPSTLSYVITDRRFAQSLTFGSMLAEQGAQTLEVTSGLTRLWREALLPLWQGKGGAIAGITDHGTWACIAEQARSHGRRSILVGRHAVASTDGPASHLLTMAEPPAKVVALLDRGGDAWPNIMADLIARYPIAARPVPNLRHQGPVAIGSNPVINMTSWIIA